MKVRKFIFIFVFCAAVGVILSKFTPLVINPGYYIGITVAAFFLSYKR